MPSASPSVIRLSYWWALETNLRKPGFSLPPGRLVGVVTSLRVPVSLPSWRLPGSVSPAGNLFLPAPSYFPSLSIHYADMLFFSVPVPLVYSTLYLSPMLLLFICRQSVCEFALGKLRNTGHQSLSLRCLTCQLQTELFFHTFTASSNLDEFSTPSIHKSTRRGMSERRGGRAGWGQVLFVLLQSELNICLHIYKWEIQEQSVRFHILEAPGSRPGSAAAPAADFCNSYLDEWLKLSHSQQESPHSYLREEWASCHLLIHCLPSCMQTRHALPTIPLFISYVSLTTFLNDWSGTTVASLETHGKSAHPDNWGEKTPQHADLISRRNKRGVQPIVNPCVLKFGYWKGQSSEGFN